MNRKIVGKWDKEFLIKLANHCKRYKRLKNPRIWWVRLFPKWIRLAIINTRNINEDDPEFVRLDVNRKELEKWARKELEYLKKDANHSVSHVAKDAEAMITAHETWMDKLEISQEE